MDLAKRFENKNELQPNQNQNLNNSNKTSTNADNPNTNNTENKADFKMTDLPVIQSGTGRVSTILNKITHKPKEVESTEKVKPEDELNQNKKASEKNASENAQITNSNINPEEIMQKINSNILNNPNTKSRDTHLLKSNINTIEKNEEINFGNQKYNIREDKEIEKISDDSMIQDFKNLLKFKKKTSDPFDMEYDLNYKDKANQNDLELYPINSKEIITFEEAERMKFIENESDKSEDLVVQDIEKEIEYLENVDDILSSKNKNVDLKHKGGGVGNSEEAGIRGRNSTFKFRTKNSLGKKPLNFKIENKLNGDDDNEKNALENNAHEKKESSKNQQMDNEMELFKNILKNKKTEKDDDIQQAPNTNAKEFSNSEITENTIGTIYEKASYSNKRVTNTRKSAKADIDSKRRKERADLSLADENKSNISDLSRTSVISLERKSVKYYVRKVEKSIKKQQMERESVETKRRNTHSHRKRKHNSDIFNENLEEIREILAKLKLQNSENEKDFLEKNRDLLKQMGVHEKDMLSIQELINYFEEQLNPKKKLNKELENDRPAYENNNINLVDKETLTSENKNENFNIGEYNSNNNENDIYALPDDFMKRNTANHAKKLYENVSQILEEKEEDSSFFVKDKERISDNANNNNLGEKKKWNNNIRSLVSPNNAAHKIFGFDISKNNNSLNMISNITPIRKNLNFENLSDNEKFDLNINSNYNRSARSKNMPYKETDLSNRKYGRIIYEKENFNKQMTSPTSGSNFGIRSLNSNDMEMFNPEKDQIECITPRNVFDDLNKNKKTFNNQIEGENKLLNKQVEYNIFTHNLNTFDGQIKPSNSNTQEEPKVFENKNLYSSNAEVINIEPNRKTSFKPKSFTIDNVSNTPRKTQFLNFIADANKNNPAKELKVELINNFIIEGIRKPAKEKSITICKENDNLFEIVSNTNNDITKASSINFNANSISAAKNANDKNNLNGK